MVDGTVVFRAAPGETNHVLTNEPGGLTVTDTGAPLTVGPGCEQLDANRARCTGPDTGFDFPVDVTLGDGDDFVGVTTYHRKTIVHGGVGDDAIGLSSSGTVGSELDGGPGNDVVTGSEQLGGTTVYRGGPGDDVLRITWYSNLGGREYGGDGDDVLYYEGSEYAPMYPLVLDGGNGNDTYRFGRDFVPDAMVPSPGLDTLDMSTSALPESQPFSFDFATCHACVQRVIGTPNADAITGDDAAQLILGGDGNDVLDGGGGPDVIAGQGGDDTVMVRDRMIDAVGCDGGSDLVVADRFDLVGRDCEDVSRR